MPIFTYEGKTKNGAIRKGKMDVAEKEDVVAALREIGVYPISIELEKKDTLNKDLSDFKKVTLKDIYIFCREFSYVIAAGISIVRAMEILKEQTENPKLRKSINAVLSDIQKGQTLSKAMGKQEGFPKLLVNMVAVGEVSGSLDEILIKMADYYDKEYKQRQKVKQAITYPVVVSIFAVIVVNILVIKVLPKFIENMLQGGEGIELPLPTRIVMGVSNVLSSYWWLIIILVAAGVMIFKAVFKESSGEKLDKFKLDMPLFGKINKKLVTSRFARTLGILISSGIPVLKSIEICAEIVGNAFVQNVITGTKDEIEKGATLGETLESRNIFPPMLIQMIKIGEESGTMDSVLKKASEFYDGEVETTTAQLITMIEPIIIAILAVVVGFIMIAILLPMLQMYNAAG